MTETPFSDSYIETDAELEALIGADPRAAAIALKALAAASQEWYCQEATRRIDALPLRGTKYDNDIVAGVPDQPLAFPRIIDGTACDWNSSTSLAIVPPDIKRACMEEAIALYQYQDSPDMAYQEMGIKQLQLGTGAGFSVTYSGSLTAISIMSTRAKQIMRRYMGGVAVR
ncbi:MAG: hypothetical protein WC343_03390 [Bacilli bacterium]|jgi:hypothetical protein